MSKLRGYSGLAVPFSSMNDLLSEVVIGLTDDISQIYTSSVNSDPVVIFNVSRGTSVARVVKGGIHNAA